MSYRLAVVVSHPIQYYAPWFAQLAAEPDLTLHVFHLWDFGTHQRFDPGFGQTLQWDVPLLEGYPSSFVANVARSPGTHHFLGLNNPTLVPELLAWHPDAVLLFGYTSLTHLRLLLDPRLWRIPLLLRGDSHHLARSVGVRPALAGLLRRLLFRRFAAALAVGQANAAYLRASGIPSDRIVHAPHAVDNDRFQAAAPQAEADAQRWRLELGIAPDAPVVLFAGKFEAKKRPQDLLAAFAALQHPTAVLVLLGAGALHESLREQAASLPAAQVRFIGFQNQASMPRAYALADVVVLPSAGNAETWGLCLNEAMNLARPVIASSHVGGALDLVLPGRTGWTFPAGDVHALQACLADALADPARLRAMGRAARDHIAGFSYTQATAGLLRGLANVVPAPVVDLIVPELFARDGGIQIYSRTLINSLLAVLPARIRLRLFVRNDFRHHRPQHLDPRIRYLPCGDGPAPVRTVRFLLAPLLAVIRHPPALIISTHANFSALQIVLARIAHCPSWAAAHGIEVWNLRRGAKRWGLRRLSQLLPVSQFTAAQLRRQLGSFCPPMAVFPNSYDAQRFHPGPPGSSLLARYGLKPDQPLIFCLTRLTRADEYKQVRALIEAMPVLLHDHPDLRLIIGGTGDDLEPLRQSVQDLTLQHAIQLPGAIADEELADHYRLARLFALPSEGEGFGIVFLEAAGCGCAVLAGDRDGSVDPLLGGRYGCLVDPRQPLAPALLALLDGRGEPLWHQPEALARAVAGSFGLPAFRERLRLLLAEVPGLLGAL